MKVRHVARYYNAGGVAVAIVAVVTQFADGVFDWAAYIGGSTRIQREEDCFADVTRSGCKLMRKDAAYFFPDLPIERYQP